MAGYYGKGKNKKLLSSFLLGVKTNKEKIIPISKVGTGFTDKFLKYITEEVE